MLKVIFLIIGLYFNLTNGLVNPCKKGQTGNQFFPHPESNSKYIHCSQWGQMFVFDCAEGLVWDQLKLACERSEVFHFFQNFAKSLHQSDDSSIPQTTRKTIRINPGIPTRSSNEGRDLPFESSARLFTFPASLTTTTTTLSPQVQTFTFQAVTTTTFNPPIQSTLRAFTFPPQLATTTARNLPPLSTPSSSFQINSEPRLFTFPSSTAPTTTTTTTTTRTTTTTQVVPSVQFSTSLSPQKFQEINKLETFSTSDCSTFSISNSAISSVNGIYTKLNSDLYRRSDDLRIPGLIVHLDQKWCLTLSFFSVDFNSLTKTQIQSQCGANLECCMLISNSPDNLEISSPKREWTINMLEFKGMKDDTISIDCQNIQKACLRIPFCPPECLKNVNGCDVCECDGKPFFSLPSIQVQNQQVNQVPQSIPSPNVNQQVNQVPQSIPSPNVNQQVNQVPQSIPSPNINQQIQQNFQFTTLAAITAPSFTQPSFRFSQPNQANFGQRLLAFSNKNANIDKKETVNTTDLTIINSCKLVRCPGNLVCAEATNCKTCNPMCFPENTFELSKGFKPTCKEISCPSSSTCLLDTKDQLLKCIPVSEIQPTQLELDIQALVQLHDFDEFENKIKKHLSPVVPNTPAPKPMLAIFPSLKDQIINSNFTVKACSMVKCPSGLMCAEAKNCETCNPLCFPQNKIDLNKAVRLTCESVSCPASMRCILDTKESNLKCIV